MKKILPLLLAVTLICFLSIKSNGHFLYIPKQFDNTLNNSYVIYQTTENLTVDGTHIKKIIKPISEIKKMMYKQAPTLNVDVINKALIAFSCIKADDNEKNNIFTIIDYSLPSSEKRLWVFDLEKNKLLFNTYVSHGLKSGTASPVYFSNKFNSKASSIGVYNTEKLYYGRHGLSLKLDGLERNFNDNAENRAIVMHGAWYVDESFIKKYGRAGRSWGCPALPTYLNTQLLDTIKDKSLLFIYYPGNDWLSKSKLLNCENSPQKNTNTLSFKKDNLLNKDESREKIIFIDKGNNKKLKDTDTVVVISAENYQRIFNAKPPLERMLRRQIKNTEYIVLSDSDLNSIIATNDKKNIDAIAFVMPVIKMVRGYYATEMQFVMLGRIKEIKLNLDKYNIYFENNKEINLKSTNQFIRWIGL